MTIEDEGKNVGISALVERRIKEWEAQGASTKKTHIPPKSEEVKFYIAISRECGCNAEKIGETLEKKTGFLKYDCEILNYIAKNDEARRKLFETIDDRTMGWIESICSVLTLGPSVTETEYFNRLSHELLAICYRSNAIIIGRAASFILPKEKGLAVRLVAPRDYRLEKFAKRMDLDLKTAARQMERIDHERGNFVESHFGKFAFDPRRYDMVINVSQFTQEQTVDMILLALKAKSKGTVKLPETPSA